MRRAANQLTNAATFTRHSSTRCDLHSNTLRVTRHPVRGTPAHMPNKYLRRLRLKKTSAAPNPPPRASSRRRSSQPRTPRTSPERRDSTIPRPTAHQPATEALSASFRTSQYRIPTQHPTECSPRRTGGYQPWSSLTFLPPGNVSTQHPARNHPPRRESPSKPIVAGHGFTAENMPRSRALPRGSGRT